MFTTRTQTAIFTNIRTIFPTIILDKIFSLKRKIKKIKILSKNKNNDIKIKITPFKYFQK